MRAGAFPFLEPPAHAVAAHILRVPRSGRSGGQAQARHPGTRYFKKSLRVFRQGIREMSRDLLSYEIFYLHYKYIFHRLEIHPAQMKI